MIVFVLNNKLINTQVNPGTPLVDFLRNQQQLKGTKIGCREGDCGACTVLVGSLNKQNTIKYKSITSCISPIGNAQGKHIVTVEGVNLKNKLNKVQQYLKEADATQCGFCTPGFVMSLVGLCINDNLVTKTDAINAISGNICRCTGYKSIEKAAYNIYDKINIIPNDNDKIKWLVKNHYLPGYFLSVTGKIMQINKQNTEDKCGMIVAGGTDLYVRNADKLSESQINLLNNNDNTTRITFYRDRCIIAAETTVSDIYNNAAMFTYFPEILNYLKLVSSEPIRNMATIVGNFVNASPIGDLTIFFLALNANITLKNNKNLLRTILLKDFYKDYKDIDLNENEQIVNIAFNVPKVNQNFNFEKVSKRTHLDIASVNSAIYLNVIENKIEFIYLSFGGVAPIPLSLTETCKFLTGKTLDKEIIKEAAQFVQQEIRPISDVRGDETYKRLLARQLFYAHFLKLFPKTFNILELIS